MYTVFIADDESKVINGLINRIHWDILDTCVVGYSKNGREAEEKNIGVKAEYCNHGYFYAWSDRPAANGKTERQMRCSLYHFFGLQ